MARCYLCGVATDGRTTEAWVVRADGAPDDGVVLPPGTPVCDHPRGRTEDGVGDFGCLTTLWFRTVDIDVVARRIGAGLRGGSTHV